MSWRAAEGDALGDDPGGETLPRMFEGSAARHADRPAQHYKGGVYDRSLVPEAVEPAPDGAFASLSYGESRHVVRRLAAGFRELGVRPGDRVAIFAQTRMEWAQCDLALLAAGAVVTTVYANASPEKVGYLLDDSGATGVVVEGPDALARLREAEADLAFVASMDRLPGGEADGADVHTLGDVYALGERAYERESYEGWLEARAPDDLATIIYTSGTTGRPKGVRLTHRNVRSNVEQCLARFGPRPDKDDAPSIDVDSRMVSFLPLAHVFERLAGHFMVFAAGASVAYAESPDTLQEDFSLVRPTYGTSVPRVYERIYAGVRERASASPLKRRVFEWAMGVGRAHAEADDPGPWLALRHRLADALVFSTVQDALGGELDFLISGGGSLSPELCARFHGMGLPVLEGYGLTETSPVISVNPPEAPRVGTIGPPVVGLDVRLDGAAAPDDEFEDVDGEVGELLVSGPNVTDGYWQLPEETEAAFADAVPGEGGEDDLDGADRWFRTGDIVARDEEGYLTFLARAKELLVLSTGHNVAPTHIEDAFSATQVVEQCMVVGDGRKFVGALVVPAIEPLRAWAGREGHDLPDDPAAVCDDDRVHARVAATVDEVNGSLEPVETIKRFRLVPEPFTEENGLLTPTLKKKRRAILERHADAVDAVYAEPDG